ncbi:M10 family metallopeptidase C-terminal domain-containing protein [Brevundimonas sp.]|uniref:M10 family metallopeptidase C-terminal domain-containing protein n=1 Tax=Brevundimonas sp. TaxID=1871086 RepID=UPI0025E0EFF4|nr:M10 family metallopeptidase C-terminal domain-containing protein [Brevundimonas sp.]
MPRFSMFAAYRAVVSDELSDLAAAPGARAWGETASFAPRTQSFVEPQMQDAAFEVAPLILPAEADPTLSLRCGCSYCLKSVDRFDPDGVGDDKPDGPLQPVLLTIDAQADDVSTTATITVDGPHIVSTTDTIGDQDFFAVNLVEGQWYNIGQYLTLGGPSGVPQADAYIELYDSAGNLITQADGGGPNTPSGLDALLTYQADYTGTYYINARAYDQDGTNGSTGDFVGDYELFVDTVDFEANPYAYRPFYDTDSPLHSIDWGSQFDRTSRNPDGDNGTRPNPWAPDGNGPILTNNYGIEGKNVITYYYAKQGDVYVDEDPLDPGLATTLQAKNMEAWEKAAFRQAFDLYEQVADIIYIEVQNRHEADINIITYQGTPGVGASLLGRMSPPNEANEGQTEINAGDARWTEEGVSQGGFYFPTLLHELGHGHGMAHPHDNGGRSSIMRGGDGGTGGLGGGFGDFDLSQQVFTIMSYNDGWNETGGVGGRPAGHGGPRSGGITGTEVDHFGWMGTLAALDIAVIQDKYGVNEEWATGNDVYEIKDFNGAGNFYSTIWDAGGTDEIRYSGTADATIDLRAATLRYEEGGGGRVSYAYGLWGGFTIANGVTIENATGGRGDDVLIGNEAANTLKGGLGADRIDGGNGDDVLNGGSGDDILIGGAGRDRLLGGPGSDLADYSSSNAAVQIRLGLNRFEGGHAQGDELLAVENVRGSNFSDQLIGSDAANAFYGGSGKDYLDGAIGDDRLDGGAGNDRLRGSEGSDTFIFRGASGSDLIYDLEVGQDVISLDGSIFADFADVLIHTSDDGSGNAVISKSGVTITLQGVSKAQLQAGDFEFAVAAPAAAEPKDLGPQVLPAEKDGSADDAIICPVLGDVKATSDFGDDFDPLVLPLDMGPKDIQEAPVVCQPGSDVLDLGPADVTSLWDDIGRGPHHRLAHSDWAVLV